MTKEVPAAILAASMAIGGLSACSPDRKFVAPSSSPSGSAEASPFSSNSFSPSASAEASPFVSPSVSAAVPSSEATPFGSKKASPQSSATEKNPCDTDSLVQETVEPNRGNITVFATATHPSVIVIDSRTPGKNKSVALMPVGNKDWQTANAANDASVATVIVTSTNLRVNTNDGRGFWFVACEPTPQAARDEVKSREQDVFTKDNPTAINEFIIDASGKVLTKRTLPSGTNPYSNSIAATPIAIR